MVAVRAEHNRGDGAGKVALAERRVRDDGAFPYVPDSEQPFCADGDSLAVCAERHGGHFSPDAERSDRFSCRHVPDPDAVAGRDSEPLEVGADRRDRDGAESLFVHFPGLDDVARSRLPDAECAAVTHSRQARAV